MKQDTPKEEQTQGDAKEEFEYFGTFIKSKRIESEFTLREFCRQIRVDASNWHKIESKVLDPPIDEDVLNKISSILKFNEMDNSKMRDLAIGGRLPDWVKEYNEKKLNEPIKDIIHLANLTKSLQVENESLRDQLAAKEKEIEHLNKLLNETIHRSR